jgi:hypothetical protein
MIDEDNEALETAMADAALGLTAWRAALRRELRLVWHRQHLAPVVRCRRGRPHCYCDVDDWQAKPSRCY